MNRSNLGDDGLEDSETSSDTAVASTPLKRRRTHRPLSRVLRDFANQSTGDVRMSDLRDALGDRSFAALLVVFSAVNLIPVLPPFSTLVFGIPPLIIAFQMLMGHESVWLPKKILNWSFSSDTFRKIMSSVTPKLRRLEYFVKPRFWPFTTKNGERLVGATSVLLSILVILPIPGANWIPAFAMVLMGLSLSQRDGALYAVGCSIGIGFLAFMITVASFVVAHLGAAVDGAVQYVGSFF